MIYLRETYFFNIKDSILVQKEDSQQQNSSSQKIYHNQFWFSF